MTHATSAHTAAALISLLRTLDVHLRVEGGLLRVNAPKGRLTPELEAALVARKTELLQVLSETPRAPHQPRALTQIERGGSLPLSFLQERIWLVEQIRPGQTAYNLATVSDVVDDCDIAMLVSAIRAVITRHEVLRARFVLVQNEPRVLLAAAEDTPVIVRDLRALSVEEQNHVISGAPAIAVREPFALSAQAPVRFTILQLGERRMALLLAAHHIAMDSWSMGVLGQEVMAEYVAATGGEARAPLALQYADFAAWQRAEMDDPMARERLQYWTARLSGLPQLSAFTTDRPRRAASQWSGATYDFRWSPALFDDVRALARDLNATVYMVLLAAMAVVLTRNTGQTDVAIGSPIGTRELAEMEDMLGPILNPLVMRFDVGDDPSFATLVERAKAAVLDGHANQNVPFELLVKALNPDRSMDHPPLFQVAVVLHNAPDAGAVQIHGGGAIYDITMFAVERRGEMTGAFEYRADLYDESTIARIDTQLQVLLGSASRTPQLATSCLPLLTADDVAEQIATLIPVHAPIDADTVVAQFARTAQQCGAAMAVVAGDATLTYAELDQRSTQVAVALQAAGAGRGTFVALATDRSQAMVVGALGILKAGAAYVPIDVSYPADRVAFMLRDCGARHMVATAVAVRAVRADDLPATVLLVDEVTSRPSIALPALNDPATPSDIAYLMYTSGSTGTPKGVVVPHSAVSNFLGAMRLRPGISAADRVLSVTSMSFDISVLEVFLPLVTGARTIVATRDDASDGARLAELIRTSGASIVQATPSGWRLLMHAAWVGDPSIVAIAGGETMPPELAQWMLARTRQVWNGYGPTEATVYASMALLSNGGPITIGTPVANTHIYVMDSAGNVAPVGAPGEICIGGDSVARGYHQRDELTAEKFVADPFVAGRTMYRTGDYGRWRTDGLLDHMGRIDGQVKLRGYRIETGEIEAALATHAMVRSAVVGVRNASADDPRLMAWVQLHDDGECTASELRRYLRQSLPEFMIPSMLMFVDRFPLTPNAKVDRKALPDPFASTPLTPREYIAPSTPTERLISEIWITLLGVNQAGVTDSFFELGGYSLLAMRAASEISVRTGRVIEPRLLFFRTLGQLAEALDAPIAGTAALRP
ncbi:MAG: amino acid adenylation domain-containing protein [Gemmatimonadaceae bacterium]|nr:amino acid adenylation domain-containing protein [Gemmatimonadaceae bacterium]